MSTPARWTPAQIPTPVILAIGAGIGLLIAWGGLTAGVSMRGATTVTDGAPQANLIVQMVQWMMTTAVGVMQAITTLLLGLLVDTGAYLWIAAAQMVFVIASGVMTMFSASRLRAHERRFVILTTAVGVAWICVAPHLALSAEARTSPFIGLISVLVLLNAPIIAGLVTHIVPRWCLAVSQAHKRAQRRERLRHQ